MLETEVNIDSNPSSVITIIIDSNKKNEDDVNVVDHHADIEIDDEIVKTNNNKINKYLNG